MQAGLEAILGGCKIIKNVLISTTNNADRQNKFIF